MSRFFTRQAVKINMDYKQFLNKISEPLDGQPAEKKTKKAMTQSRPDKVHLHRSLPMSVQTKWHRGVEYDANQTEWPTNREQSSSYLL